jgi:ComF family protein
MKYHNQLAIAELMGNLLAKKIKQATTCVPDVIIPIPLHLSRLQQRGYNQAIEIARPVSRALNIPINFNHCIRKRNTTPQFDLVIAERTKNMQQAFELIHKITAKHVAIIDDVMTTGSTVWELSKNLIASGVERVDVWTCARATIN